MTVLARDRKSETPMQGVFSISGTKQKVAIGAASAVSAAVGEHCRAVRLWASVDCLVEIGADPTALTETDAAPSTPLTAKQEYVFTIEPGDKVAVIDFSAGTGGVLYITEL